MGRFGSEAAVARTEWVESDHRWAVAPVCIANAEPGGRHVPVRRLASPTAGNGSIRGRAARHSELDTGNRTSRGEIRLEAAPVLVYRKFSIPKLDDVNPKLDEFRHQLSKFSALGIDITVKSRSYGKCVIYVGPDASLKLGFCKKNVT